MSRLTLEDLLNPVPEVDARPQLLMLQNFLANSHPGAILVSPELQNSLKHVVDQLNRLSARPEALREPLLNIPTRSVKETKVEHDVIINRKTKLSTLYRYPPNTYIEYPETSEEPIGHLFELDPQNWQRPTLDFTYSQGKPDGQSLKTEEINCPLLVNIHGELVSCVKSFSTCKLCQPFM